MPSSPHRPPPRAGASLLECCLAIAILGAIAATAAGAVARWQGWLARQAARREVVAAFARARAHAQLAGRRTAVAVRPPFALTVHAGDDTVAHLDLSRHHVRVTSPPDSMAFAASGLGWGASNLRVLLTRDARSDTVFVSRLGRVRVAVSR